MFHCSWQGFIKTQEIVTLEVTVWHVLEYEHCKLPELSRGQFHDGDTYVVRWQYMITNASKWMVLYFQVFHYSELSFQMK